MKIIIHDQDQKFEEIIRKKFENDGEELNIITDDGTIHNCVGCFQCWIKTPTECMWKDKYSHMSKVLREADELILISRCYYGTYSPFVRNVLDRSLSYIHPDFTKRNHEIHHKTRYSNRMKTSAYFYGDMTLEEKETAKKVVKANIMNFNGIENGVYFMKEAEDILREPETEVIKIALITASPKGKNSASKCLIDMLRKQLGDIKLEEFVWNRMSCSKDDMEKIGTCDAIVFAFPLYIDSIPSHLLRCLIQLQEYLQSINAGKDIHAYVIVNNGFFDSKQCISAIDVMRNWAERAGISFGQGIAVGGGGMLIGLKDVPDEHRLKKNIYLLLGELAENIRSRKMAETKTILPKIPGIIYKLVAQKGWRKMAKKNGLKSSDLGKRA